MRGGWTKVGLSGAAIVALAIGIFVYGEADRASLADVPAVQAVPVIATKVQQHDVPIILTGLGTVTALNTATIHSQITGLLVSVDFREGQTVKKGDLLAQIDPRTNQAQLDQAQATLEHDQVHLKNAQLNLQRFSDLVKTDAATQQQLDNQQAAVEELNAQIKSDQAAVENAKAQLSYTRLVAPFDGITGIRLLDVGNIIHPPTGSAATQSNTADTNGLVVVTQVQPISIIFTLATTNISEVQAAMVNGPLQAMAWSQDDKTELDVGELAVVNNQADPGSGTIQLKAVFPNQQRKLWPGDVRQCATRDRNGAQCADGSARCNTTGAAGIVRFCRRPGQQGNRTAGLGSPDVRRRGPRRERIERRRDRGAARPVPALVRHVGDARGSE